VIDGVLYLDCNATTPVDPRVMRAMEPFFTTVFANASSPHTAGSIARDAVEAARSQVAGLIGAAPQEIVFTSGATESNNLVVAGVLAAAGGGHVVSVQTEHKALLDPLEHLRRSGGTDVTLLRPDRAGRVSAEQVRAALRDETVLVSVMAANNELGTLAPLAEIGSVCRAAGVLFHTDAAQLTGKLPANVEKWRADLVSLSAHKMYGPKGIGALYVRRSTRISPAIRGGGHERGLRSGTLNVPAIVGFGAACALSGPELHRDIRHSETLRALLLDGLQREFPDLEVNGSADCRLPGTLNVRLPGIDADSLIAAAPRVAMSSGSACTSATPEPSHVLLAVGRTWDQAQECVRFGVGRFTTEAEVLAAVGQIAEAGRRLRAGRRAGAIR
jgi:cysteine desulfurase